MEFRACGCRAPARRAHGGGEHFVASAPRRAGNGRAGVTRGRALQFACGKCGRRPERGEPPPAVDEIAAPPCQPAGPAVGFGGHRGCRTRRRPVCRRRLFAGGRCAVGGGAGENCRREIKVSGIADSDRYDRRPAFVPARQWLRGKQVPSFVLHYGTADLETLPDLLEQRIRSGKYHSAAVGACRSDAKSAFSNYRIAVLLFEQ